jgi:transcription-repair coupling factor (superfamily II helicase)
MLTSPLSKIFSAARALGEPIRVAGLLGSSKAWFILRAWREFSRPLVVVCPDDEAAAILMSDCDALSEVQAGDPPMLLHVPAWERPAFSPIEPSIRIRHQRAAALSEIACRKAARPIIFTTVAGLAFRTLGPHEFEGLTLRIPAKGPGMSRDEVVRRLVDAGYSRLDTVEDPGTFALRGEILDVFPPTSTRPWRIEYFDDEVERVRPFEPSTQRALDGAPDGGVLILPPCREVLLTAETRPRVRERLKEFADTQDIPRTRRDPVLEALAIGGYPERSDFWAAIASSQPSTLVDHLPANCLFIQWDDLGCDQSWDQLWSDEQAGMAKAADLGSILPPPAQLYDLELVATLRRRMGFILQKVAIAELSDSPEPAAEMGAVPSEGAPTASHRVSVRPNSDLAATPAGGRLDLLVERLLRWAGQGLRVLIDSPTPGQSERLAHLLAGRGLSPGTPELRLTHHALSEGFRWASEGWVALTESEALGDGRSGRRRARERGGSATGADWSGLQALADLSPGDTVVHVDHGIGRYLGIVRLSNSGAPSEFLQIEYAGADKLYLPVYRLNQIQKHGAGTDAVPLDRLGSAQFQKTKAKVRDSVRTLAFDLVKLYAERSLQTGHRYPPRDELMEEFEASFAYEETPDQSAAIDSVLSDLAEGKIMDRLVCGDVGYGKTEVAIRAAYRVVTSGRQVAVLVPTTLLAHQHEQSFRSRLSGLPVGVDSLSRFKNAREQKAVLSRVAEGKVDILIGTHRLLSRDIRFRELGLLVVDEEHRFGVEHKEKIKALKTDVPVLTLTATPIPRTLHMALSGLREISLIRTPPVDRLPIRTFVAKQDDAVIQRAIEFELSRGGQVFYLHNRVDSIFEAAARVKALCPAAVVTVAHGQMGEGELEEAVRAFYDKRSNVLVCTSIIESGIDLPSANTIIIHRADTFGLAQLYQIRGRVGRGQQRGYAYLLIPSEAGISEDAKKRLDVIQRFVELGSGFSVASHDLDIRGGGDLLGPQQSGNIMAVGFDLYLSLLEEAIQEIRSSGGPPTEPEIEPEIKAPFPSFLPEDYVPDVHQRLSLYRRLSSAHSDADVDSLESELLDRFGPMPEPASSLLWLIRVKVQLKRLGIDALTVGPERVVLTPGRKSALDPVRAIALVSGHPRRYSITPESRFVAREAVGSMKDLYFALESLLQNLAPAQGVAKPSRGG